MMMGSISGSTTLRFFVAFRHQLLLSRVFYGCGRGITGVPSRRVVTYIYFQGLLELEV